MASVNVTISKDAYDFLRRLKRNGQSFSDVILTMKQKKQDVLSYAGIFQGIDLSSIEAVRINARKDWEKR
ncbi:MAG TPA: antitoxin VapB family protein [Candidatus Nanoarchaeia archaeon]|nr:antitoxin VapB family protein [Candidatus Nanoarchaeia archaeon]